MQFSGKIGQIASYPPSLLGWCLLENPVSITAVALKCENKQIKSYHSVIVYLQRAALHRRRRLETWRADRTRSLASPGQVTQLKRWVAATPTLLENKTRECGNRSP